MVILVLLVTESLCWWLFSSCWWPPSVTNIDVANHTATKNIFLGQAKNDIVPTITLSNEFKIKKKMEYDFFHFKDTTDCFLFMVSQIFLSLYHCIFRKNFNTLMQSLTLKMVKISASHADEHLPANVAVVSDPKATASFILAST